MEQKVLRFGVAGAGERLRAWQARCLEALFSHPGVELALRIAGSPGGDEAMGTEGPRFGSLALLPAASPARWRQAPVLAATELERIRGYGLDFVLDLSQAMASRTLLQTARLGIWCFAHGDPAEAPRWPPCIHEIEQGKQIAQAGLWRLQADRPPLLLHDGAFRLVGHSLGRSLDRVLEGVASWPARACCELQLDVSPSARENASPRGATLSVRREPVGPARRLRLASRLSRNLLARISRELTEERWCVGVIERPVHTLLEDSTSPTIRWLDEARDGHSLADPFAPPGGDGSTLLVEDYDPASGRGVLACLEAAADPPRVRPVLPGPGHRSYPYLVAHEGRIYCIPETSEERALRLYRAEAFPLRWREEAVLLSDFAAVDATVFEHEDRWWLLCGDRDADDQTQLFGFHAPALTGPWQAHPLNPLKCDPRSSRPAGRPFRHGGALYRPAQDCSEVYGGAVVLNRILRLTPTAFAEVSVARIAPDPSGPYPDGLHTLCEAGDRTLVDGKRHYRSTRRTATRLLRRASEWVITSAARLPARRR